MKSRFRLVVLDRDGVINEESPEFVKSPAEWKPIAGSLEGIALLTSAGYTVAVATNQSGIGRKLMPRGAVEEIHREMTARAAAAGGAIDRVVYCPHAPGEGCDCRKPAPGMLRALAAHYGTSLAAVPVVGDSERDLAAARAVGARPVLVRTGNGRTTEAALAARGAAVEAYDDLAAAARALAAEAS